VLGRGRALLLASGEVAYAAATVVVLQGRSGASDADGGLRAQRFFTRHGQVVQALAAHPDGERVASSEGFEAGGGRVFVWHAESLTVLATVVSRAGPVGVLAFSQRTGSKLLTVCNSAAHHPVAVWDWQKQVLLAEEGGDEALEHTILDAHFWPKGHGVGGKSADSSMVTAGVAHLRFWTLRDGGVLSNRRASLPPALQDPPPTFVCVACLENELCVAGTDAGLLLVWAGPVLVRQVAAHDGPAFALAVNQAERALLSAGADGVLRLWGFDSLQARGSLDIAHVLAGSTAEPRAGERKAIESIEWSRRYPGAPKNSVVVATGDADILEVEWEGVDIEEPREVILHVGAHAAGPVTALCTHPAQRLAASGGQDGTIRLWEIGGQNLMCAMLRAPAAVLALDFSPGEGSFLCAGLADGAVLLLDALAVAAEMGPPRDCIASGILLLAVNATRPSRRGEGATCVRFSAAGDALAAGFTDGRVEVWVLPRELGAKPGEEPLLEGGGVARLEGMATGQTAAVTSIDWDVEGRYLRTNNSAGDLDLWERTAPGYHVPNSLYGGGAGVATEASAEPRSQGVMRVKRAAAARDVVWATSSCPLSWSSLGTFRSGQESSVRAVARQQCAGARVQAVAMEDGRVRLLPFPCPDVLLARGTELLLPTREASHVAFSFDDSYIVAAGGSDGALVVLRAVKVCSVHHPPMQQKSSCCRRPYYLCVVQSVSCPESGSCLDFLSELR